MKSHTSKKVKVLDAKKSIVNADGQDRQTDRHRTTIPLRPIGRRVKNVLMGTVLIMHAISINLFLFQ